MLEKIIITGTLGFIGSNLKKELESRFEIIQINEDIFQSISWREEVSKFFWTDLKAVFHVGACSNTLESDVNYMMLVNYEFTKHLSNLCASKKVSLVYSSSAANYGTNGEYPANLYGWSKYAAEDYVISKGGIGLRYFNVYGPGEENKGKMASVAYQMSVAHNDGKEIKLFPKNPRRDFVYVKDVISANLHAFENYEPLKGKYYEVGSGEPRAFEDVLDILEIPFTYHPIESIPKGYQFFTKSDGKKWMPRWFPEWNLERGLSDYFGRDI
jgi:ADP-L-glycero-D-manno-heptose 6-epimerase